MRVTKVILLSIALLLPISIFLFLKFFGKNEFNVKPLYQDSVPEISSDCGSYSAPYYVHDSIPGYLKIDSVADLTIFFLQQRDSSEQQKQMTRISEEFFNDPVDLIWIQSTDSEYERLRQCVFLLRGDTSVVMLDHLRRIRGNYLGSLKDMDRLIVEAKIILKKTE